MATEYGDVLTFVQHLAPTWRKTQQRMLEETMVALLERPTLCESEIARGLPPGLGAREPASLHGRLKRLSRFLGNPRLDEEGLWRRCSLLSCRFGEDWPSSESGEGILPLLMDTTYFEPFAALTIGVPCGSRGLTIALSTYHRHSLLAATPQPSARPRYWDSQNRIEENLLDYVLGRLAPGVRAVVVADAGFARASLLRHLLERGCHFVIRFDADTHVTLPDGRSGEAQAILALAPGQSRFLPQAYYGKEARVPLAVLGLWQVGQEEPWYLATSLDRAELVACLYRWRMRIEAGYRDDKSGVICRQGGDTHRLSSLVHLHRLLMACLCLHWLLALVGLQAHTTLPQGDQAPGQSALETAPPDSEPTAALIRQGPAMPPAPLPHRGPTPPLPQWMKRFAVRGHLSYVRLGLEVLRAPDLVTLLRRLVHWLGIYLWPFAPAWSKRQLRYRRQHWWPTPAS